MRTRSHTKGISLLKICRVVPERFFQSIFFICSQNQRVRKCSTTPITEAVKQPKNRGIFGNISNHERGTAKRWCILQTPGSNLRSGQPVKQGSSRTCISATKDFQIESQLSLLQNLMGSGYEFVHENVTAFPFSLWPQTLAPRWMWVIWPNLPRKKILFLQACDTFPTQIMCYCVKSLAPLYGEREHSL